MKFHIEYTYTPENRERLIRMLHEGGLSSDDSLKIVGAWISLQTGAGYAIVDVKDAKKLYELCSTWSDFGQVKLTPVLPASDI